MKKKVIFVTKALWIGGIETALVNLLNHMDYEKYEVTCLVLKAELDMAEQINPNCRLLVVDRYQMISFDKKYRYERLYHLTEEPENPSKLHQLCMGIVPAIRWIENRLYIKYIREMMKRETFDTAIIYSDVVAEAVIRGIKASKYLMFYHHGAMRHVYHDQIGYRKCEKIIAVSDNLAKKLKQFVPDYAEKMLSIHNLMDVEAIREKSEASIPERFEASNINIVSCGRVSHEKGMDLAVEVCVKLVDDGWKNIKWWIVGGGPAEQEVKDRIEKLHMEEYVMMLGMKNNPYPYIKRADLYVQPSRFEGYPMTLLEAIALGKVIVSTENAGAREVLKNGEYGMLCSQNMGEIASAIEKLLEAPQILQEWKQKATMVDLEQMNLESMEKLERIL